MSSLAYYVVLFIMRLLSGSGPPSTKVSKLFVRLGILFIAVMAVYIVLTRTLRAHYNYGASALNLTHCALMRFVGK